MVKKWRITVLMLVLLLAAAFVLPACGGGKAKNNDAEDVAAAVIAVMPIAVKKFITACPVMQINPPVKNALGILEVLLELGEAFFTISLYCCCEIFTKNISFVLFYSNMNSNMKIFE